MNGLFKIISITVPAIALVIFLTFHQQQEHKAEMRTESAAFERDWNEQTAAFSKNPEDKAKFQKRAEQAHSKYSSMRIEFEDKKKTVDHLGTEMDSAMKENNKRQARKSINESVQQRIDNKKGASDE